MRCFLTVFKRVPPIYTVRLNYIYRYNLFSYIRVYNVSVEI